MLQKQVTEADLDTGLRYQTLDRHRDGITAAATRVRAERLPVDRQRFDRPL